MAEFGGGRVVEREVEGYAGRGACPRDHMAENKSLFLGSLFTYGFLVPQLLCIFLPRFLGFQQYSGKGDE